MIEEEREDLMKVKGQLKEEIDSLREHRLKVDHDVEELRNEKERFEKQWELLDERKERVQKEREHVELESKRVEKWLQDGEIRLKQEKKELWEKIDKEWESVFFEKQAFLIHIEKEKGMLFAAIQKEREEITRDMELHRTETERSLEEKRAEIEQQKAEVELKLAQTSHKETENIHFIQEHAHKERQDISRERQKLEKEKEKLAKQRAESELEWAEIKKDIEELTFQRQNLKEQREGLRLERKEALEEAGRLRKLKDEIERDTVELSDKSVIKQINYGEVLSPLCTQPMQDSKLNTKAPILVDGAEGSSGKVVTSTPPTPARFSWLQRCASIFFSPASMPRSDTFANPFARSNGNPFIRNETVLGDTVEFQMLSSPKDDPKTLRPSSARVKQSRSKGCSNYSQRYKNEFDSKGKARINRNLYLEGVNKDVKNLGDLEEDRQSSGGNIKLDNNLRGRNYYTAAAGEDGHGFVESMSEDNSRQQHSSVPLSENSAEMTGGKHCKKRLSSSKATSEQENFNLGTDSQKGGRKKRRQQESLLLKTSNAEHSLETAGATRYNFRNSTVASMMGAQSASAEDKGGAQFQPATTPKESQAICEYSPETISGASLADPANVIPSCSL
ncbi:hypothetical protein O6H91_19G001200 [Diphasiastrum complanatum]|nr:hypothetical protein O6H91_19G001200 [Diphasiastrum complanatum]